MAVNSFYSKEELATLGLRTYGTNVLISRLARLYSPSSISLGHDVRIDDFCILSAGAEIVIGSYIHISAYSSVFGGGGVMMEDFSAISSRVAIYSQSDDFSGRSMTNSMVPEAYRPFIVQKPVHLGRHALIGTNSTVMPGVMIGEGAAVGAHSLVLSDCEPWSIYVGSPSRRLRDRSRDLLQLETAFLNSAN